MTVSQAGFLGIWIITLCMYNPDMYMYNSDFNPGIPTQSKKERQGRLMKLSMNSDEMYSD